MSAGCPECGKPMTWIGEWRVWICGDCWIEVTRIKDAAPGAATSQQWGDGCVTAPDTGAA